MKFEEWLPPFTLVRLQMPRKGRLNTAELESRACPMVIVRHPVFVLDIAPFAGNDNVTHQTPYISDLYYETAKTFNLTIQKTINSNGIFIRIFLSYSIIHLDYLSNIYII
jgi:hypothetical protein